MGESDEEEQEGLLSGEEKSTESGGSGSEDEDAKGSQAYKPPKMVSMEYTADKVHQQTPGAPVIYPAA